MKQGRSVKMAAQHLLRGELVIVPTETVYGLAANMYDRSAIRCVFKAKRRPRHNPLIVHVPDVRLAEELSSSFSPLLKTLCQHFWPGPLTVLLPKQRHLFSDITAGQARVAVRVPAHPLMLKLLNTIQVPLVAPSANLSGHLSPTKPSHIDKELKMSTSYLLDGGTCHKGLESSIVGEKEGKVYVYRLGSVTLEEMEKVLGCQVFLNEEKVSLPGIVDTHYAPRKRLVGGDVSRLLRRYGAEDVILILFKKWREEVPRRQQIVLSSRGDLAEASKAWFEALHRAEKMKGKWILVERFPEQGLGRTLNDRWQRASEKTLVRIKECAV